MARKLKIITQPPINRFGRRDGRPRPWLTLVLLAVGLAMLAAGLMRTYPAAGGAVIWEPQLVELVSRGGVHRAPATGPAATQAAGQVVLQPVEKPPDACPT